MRAASQGGIEIGFHPEEVDPESAAGARTRVLLEATLGKERWSTIGVSQNIIEASCEALADSLELHLLRQRERQAQRGAEAAC